MIRLAADRCIAVKAGLCPAHMGIFALKQLAQMDIYSQSPGLFDLWLQISDDSISDQNAAPHASPYLCGDVVAAISRFSGVLTVSARTNLSAEALEELRLFVQQLGGCKLEGEERLLQRLGVVGDALLPFLGSWMMTASTQPPLPNPPQEAVSFQAADSLAEVYQLFCRVDARFAAQTQYDAWLVDFSHRCRHGQSECYILKGESGIISTICILYFGNGQALVGGVATDPAHRNKGYARRILVEFCRMTNERGLVAHLLAVDDQLAEFYERCGWKKQVRWASRGLTPL